MKCGVCKKRETHRQTIEGVSVCKPCAEEFMEEAWGEMIFAPSVEDWKKRVIELRKNWLGLS